MLAKPSITEILSYTHQIGAADLLAFAGGAIEIVPPPGDGKLILPVYVALIYNFNSVDFSTSAMLDVEWHGTGITAVLTNFLVITGMGASAFAAGGGASDYASAEAVAGFINQGLDLVLQGGAFDLAGIGSASISAAGTGYAAGDTGTVTTGNGDATYEVLTIGAAGAVATFKITFPGSGYAAGAGQATATGGAQPGVGINFTIDVLTLVHGDGSLKVTTLYQVIDVP